MGSGFHNRAAGLALAACLATALGAAEAAADGAAPASPAPTAAEADGALRFLGRMNRLDALEPAGSHGSYGLGVGAGAASYDPPAGNPVLSSQLGAAANGEGSYPVPRVWLTKGLPWPVDVALGAGAPANGGFSQVTGYAQWTVYEALARPAVSVRASYGRLFGLSGTTLASTSAEAVAGMGFLRYFTVFAAGGLSRHVGSLELRRIATPGVALTGDDPVTIKDSWFEVTRSAGLRVTLVPMLSVTAQADIGPGNLREYAAKLNYGM